MKKVMYTTDITSTKQIGNVFFRNPYDAVLHNEEAKKLHKVEFFLGDAPKEKEGHFSTPVGLPKIGSQNLFYTLKDGKEVNLFIHFIMNEYYRKNFTPEIPDSAKLVEGAGNNFFVVFEAMKNEFSFDFPFQKKDWKDYLPKKFGPQSTGEHYVLGESKPVTYTWKNCGSIHKDYARQKETIGFFLNEEEKKLEESTLKFSVVQTTNTFKILETFEIKRFSGNEVLKRKMQQTFGLAPESQMTFALFNNAGLPDHSGVLHDGKSFSNLEQLVYELPQYNKSITILVPELTPEQVVIFGQFVTEVTDRLILPEDEFDDFPNEGKVVLKFFKNGSHEPFQVKTMETRMSY